jgi:hypothetical protein
VPRCGHRGDAHVLQRALAAELHAEAEPFPGQGTHLPRTPGHPQPAALHIEDLHAAGQLPAGKAVSELLAGVGRQPDGHIGVFQERGGGGDAVGARQLSRVEYRGHELANPQGLKASWRSL